MRVLFLIPGSSASQLQAFPAVAAVADQLQAQVQVVCPTASTAIWALLPQVKRVLAFGSNGEGGFGAGSSFGTGSSLADWTNLLGSVRDPDFQACINLATGRQVNLMLSMTHIPTRIAQAGFGLTERVRPGAGWPNQTLEAYLRPLGVSLDAEAFRLSLPRPALEQAVAALPAGDGPALLLAPAGGAGDWPEAQWRALPEQVRLKVPGLRVLHTSSDGSPVERAAQVAAADVVLGSDPISIELAMLSGTPLVALGRSSDQLPVRRGLQGIGTPGSLDQLGVPEVLQALGLG